MNTHPDLRVAALCMADLVAGVPDDALGLPTPCANYIVGDLLDHIGGFAIAFTTAAVKKPLEGGPSGDAANLHRDWRSRIRRHLLESRKHGATRTRRDGMTGAGGIDLPGEVAGVVTLDELVIHGWDLAQATGQTAEYNGPELWPCTRW